MRRTLIVLVLLGLSALFLSIACSRQSESNTVEIRLGEFSFKPETVQLKAGQKVKIELINEGKTEHEFMVGRGVKEEGEGEAHEGMHDKKEQQVSSEMEHKHHEEMHEANMEMSKRFERNFFEGIDVLAQTQNGAEFMKVPGHGTMVALKPQSKATLTFKIPADRKGKWEMACFVPGHYEAKMKGEIIVK
jgi:uncharacterized cupredoxin-like copper-binding protein